MGRPRKYSPEVRERAVRLVFDHEPGHSISVCRSSARGPSTCSTTRPGPLNADLGRPMVGRDVVTRAALLVEPEPPLALLPEVVLPPHADDRAHPREAVEHHRDERPVAPAP